MTDPGLAQDLMPGEPVFIEFGRAACAAVTTLNHSYGAGETIHRRGEQECYRNLPVRLSDGLRSATRRIETTPEGMTIEKTERGDFRGFCLPRLGVCQAVVLHQAS